MLLQLKPFFVRLLPIVCLSLFTSFLLGASADAQSTLGTAIPYQGQLSDGGNPATGQYDFEFKLFDAASGGAQIGSTNNKENVQVSSGNFAVELDFGGSAFTGAGRFLEIGVRAGSSTGAFTTLTPRRPLLAVPYALYSPSGAKPAYGTASNAPTDAAYAASNGNIGIGTTNPQTKLHVQGALLIDTGGNPGIYGGTGNQELNRYLQLGNSPDFQSAMGLKAGGVLVSDQYSWANPGKNDLLVKGSVGIGVKVPEERLHVVGTTRTSDLRVMNATRTNELVVVGTTSTGVLQITGGADLAEPFAMTDAAAIQPGMVVAIDPDNPGQLRLANTAYDRMVAGVVSGAGGVNSGLIMQQEGTAAAGEHPVALTGRVYVWVDADKTPVNPGDLLTTADTPGHAMKVTDHNKAQGAILGKALGTLAKGKGLVLMLVSLQ